MSRDNKDKVYSSFMRTSKLNCNETELEMKSGVRWWLLWLHIFQEFATFKSLKLVSNASIPPLNLSLLVLFTASCLVTESDVVSTRLKLDPPSTVTDWELLLLPSWRLSMMDVNSAVKLLRFAEISVQKCAFFVKKEIENVHAGKKIIFMVVLSYIY